MVYGSENALCPFYKDESSCSIRCEGVVSVSQNNNFCNSATKKNYKNKYCCDEYNQCSLAKVLYQKYG